MISESPWHLWQSRIILTLRNAKGERLTNAFGEAVIVIREYWRMSASQQEALRAEGVTKHIWERCPLAGHAVFFLTRAGDWSYDGLRHKSFARVCESWMDAGPSVPNEREDNPDNHERSIIEKQEDMIDQGKFVCFNFFERFEDLYTGIIGKFARRNTSLVG